jgi:hypothetical protein
MKTIYCDVCERELDEGIRCQECRNLSYFELQLIRAINRLADAVALCRPV